MDLHPTVLRYIEVVDNCSVGTHTRSTSLWVESG